MDLTKFVSRIDFSGTCWIWKKGKTNGGYGIWKRQTAHRLMYKSCGFEIPPGFVVDHLCRNRACVNPFHLEAVTQLTNLMRSVGGNITKKTCKWGHEFTPENTYIMWRGLGQRRQCRACHRRREMARWHRLKGH